MTPLSLRRGFTLLEVMVALGILALSLMVMIEMQSTSVLLSSDADQISQATVLADEKMREVLLVLEREGWSTQDIAEQGDFSDFGDEEFRGESLNYNPMKTSAIIHGRTPSAQLISISPKGAWKTWRAICSKEAQPPKLLTSKTPSAFLTWVTWAWMPP